MNAHDLDRVRAVVLDRFVFARMSGTNAVGGEFEGIHVAVLRYALRLPHSTAARASELHVERLAAQDWQGLRALVGADSVYEDRGRKALERGDVDTWLTSLQFLAAWAIASCCTTSPAPATASRSARSVSSKSAAQGEHARCCSSIPKIARQRF